MRHLGVAHTAVSDALIDCLAGKTRSSSRSPWTRALSAATSSVGAVRCVSTATNQQACCCSTTNMRARNHACTQLGVGHIDKVAVAPQHRRKGVGRQLINKALTHLQTSRFVSSQFRISSLRSISSVPCIIPSSRINSLSRALQSHERESRRGRRAHWRDRALRSRRLSHTHDALELLPTRTPRACHAA